MRVCREESGRVCVVTDQGEVIYLRWKQGGRRLNGCDLTPLEREARKAYKRYRRGQGTWKQAKPKGF